MKVSRIEDYQNGWFVGNFKPSAHRTAYCEVSFMKHHKGQDWSAHYHKIATEINVLIKGKMRIALIRLAVPQEGDTLTIIHEIVAGDVFVIEPGEIIKPTFLEDCELIVVKTPSVPGDKYEL